MIAKRRDSKPSNSRAARLVKYMVAAEGSVDPRSWKRTADYILASKTNEWGEKVGGVRVTNCHTDDPAVATTLIEATQAANTRSKTDKTYHLIFSFPPGEEPDIKTLHKIEDELVASIGYADHQRISAVHIDTDHLHVHVAINKVHPKGFQNIEPFYDKLKLMEACDRLELEYGLQRTNHGLTGEKTKKEKLAERQATAEAHTGIETLTGYVTREVATAMHKAESWQELHDVLSGHGLQIKKRGAGLVIGNGELWVRASQCDRSFSLKSLTDRLGEFEQGVRPASKAYAPRPTQTHPSTSRLYEKYQGERQERGDARKRGLDQVRREREALKVQLNNWRIAQRMLVKAATKGPGRRVLLKAIAMKTKASRNNNNRGMNEKRQRVIAATASPSWMNWLMYQAQNGDAEALAVLRSRGITFGIGNTLTPRNPERSKDTVLKEPSPRINKDGSATYRTSDGGIVIDRKAQVQALKATSGAAMTALDLASKRFAGQALIVDGQDTFKSEVARLAGERGLNVRFVDAEMERTRKAAITKDKSKRRSKSTDRGMEL